MESKRSPEKAPRIGRYEIATDFFVQVKDFTKLGKLLPQEFVVPKEKQPEAD